HGREGEIIKVGSSLIKQSEPIPQDVINIHGITNEKCEKEGRELTEVLNEFAQDVSGCQRFVAHNVSFDKKIIETEYIRSELPKPFKGMTNYDTMEMGRAYLEQRKPPKLVELYSALFNGPPSNEIPLHRAGGDVALASQCFFLMKLSGKLTYLNNTTIVKQ
ncbi:MAG: hypothetical protein COB88_09540, partial [Flavobacteriales bacterium]